MSIQRVLLLSGAVCAGKSAIASLFESGQRFSRLSTSGHLRAYADAIDGGGRFELQELGDLRDAQTDFKWVVDDVARPAIAAKPAAQDWVLDAARKPRQVVHLREFFGPMVRHVHLTAPEAILIERYTGRARDGDKAYAETIRHPNEQAARSLGGVRNGRAGNQLRARIRKRLRSSNDRFSHATVRCDARSRARQYPSRRPATK